MFNPAGSVTFIEPDVEGETKLGKKESVFFAQVNLDRVYSSFYSTFCIDFGAQHDLQTVCKE